MPLHFAYLLTAFLLARLECKYSMSFVSNVLPTSLNGFSARALTHSINGGAVVPPYTARSHVTAPLYPRKPASTFLSPPPPLWKCVRAPTRASAMLECSFPYKLYAVLWCCMDCTGRWPLASVEGLSRDSSDVFNAHKYFMVYIHIHTDKRWPRFADTCIELATIGYM